MKVTRVTGIYDADGGLIGELSYVIGKARGTASCALCDVTHGLFGKKQGFRACENGLGMTVELVHLNERSPEVTAFTEGKTPCVVGHTQQGLVMLLNKAELDALHGSVRAFDRKLREKLEAHGSL